MTISVLVSTMNNDQTLIDKMNIQTNYVCVNQITELEFNKEMSVIKDNGNIWIDINDKGLSKSRNLSLANSNATVSMIADDDLRYVDGYADIVQNGFLQNPDYDILIFQVNDTKKTYKPYKDYSYDVGYLESMKVSSVQMAFKTKSVQDAQIKFNELFGSGSKYLMGEENIFLFDCLKKKLKIKYIPVQISVLTLGNSSWFKGHNDKFLFDRGATFYAMSPALSSLLILQFALRKRKLFKDKSIFQIIKIQCNGRDDYRKTLKGSTNE